MMTDDDFYGYLHSDERLLDFLQETSYVYNTGSSWNKGLLYEYVMTAYDDWSGGIWREDLHDRVMDDFLPSCKYAEFGSENCPLLRSLYALENNYAFTSTEEAHAQLIAVDLLLAEMVLVEK